MQKPTFIEQFQQQFRQGAQQSQHFLDNSFEQEVEPVQRQLNYRFPDSQQPGGIPGQLAEAGGGQLIQYQQNALDAAPPGPLDFLKIKESLKDDGTEEIKVCAILQALRWRLTKTKRKQFVKLAIYSYQSNDLLGCTESA